MHYPQKMFYGRSFDGRKTSGRKLCQERKCGKKCTSPLPFRTINKKICRSIHGLLHLDGGVEAKHRKRERERRKLPNRLPHFPLSFHSSEFCGVLLFLKTRIKSNSNLLIVKKEKN